MDIDYNLWSLTFCRIFSSGQILFYLETGSIHVDNIFHLNEAKQQGLFQKNRTGL